jgi:hypothetical protein
MRKVFWVAIAVSILASGCALIEKDEEPTGFSLNSKPVEKKVYKKVFIHVEP